MKKLFLSIILLLVVFASFGQMQKRLYTYVADTSEKFRQSMIAGDLVYVGSTQTWYFLDVPIWRTGIYNMHWVLADASRYTIPTSTQFSGTSITTTGNAVVGGSMTIGGHTIGTSFAPVATATSNLGSSSKTFKWGYIDRVIGTSSLFTTDSCTNFVASGTGKFGTSITINDQTMTRVLNGVTFNNTVNATDSVIAPNFLASGTAKAAYVTLSSTDTLTAAPLGTICYKTSDSTIYIKIRMTGTTNARWKKVTGE